MRTNKAKIRHKYEIGLRRFMFYTSPNTARTHASVLRCRALFLPTHSFQLSVSSDRHTTRYIRPHTSTNSRMYTTAKCSRSASRHSGHARSRTPPPPRHDLHQRRLSPCALRPHRKRTGPGRCLYRRRCFDGCPGARERMGIVAFVRRRPRRLCLRRRRHLRRSHRLHCSHCRHA